MNRLDFRAEILRYAPNADPPYSEPVDVTDRLLLDGVGAVNRAVERDLLSFRTGDLTIKMDNRDGYFDDLFAHFLVTDRWQFRLTRGADTLFRGILLAADGIEYDNLNKEVEVIAYGPGKILDETDGELAARTFADLTLTGGVSSGVFVLPISDTTGMQSRDVLHLDDQGDSEDVTIESVDSSTQVTLEAATTGVYTGDITKVTVPDPFYRYQTIEYLVRALFDAAGVPVAEFDISSPMLVRPVPTNVDMSNLAEEGIWAPPAERNSRVYVSVEGDGTYYATTPSSGWTNEDATRKPWIDWSRYYTQTETPPSTYLRFLSDLPEVSGSTGQLRPGICGFNFRSAPFEMYHIARTALGDPERLMISTSADGVTWGAAAAVSNLPGMGGLDIGSSTLRHVEYDYVRDYVYATWQATAGNLLSYYYDVGGATWTSLLQADDIADGKYYFAPVYCADLDCVFMMRSNLAGLQTDFEIAAFRGSQRLWVRSFPSFYVDITTYSTQGWLYPTESLRYVNGELLCLIQHDGQTCLVRSDDEFQTYRVGSLGEADYILLNGARALDAYWISLSEKSGALTLRTVMRAAALNETPIDFADFSGLSVGQALANLAAMVNAVYWVDDDLQGHFVARDLLPSGDVPEIGERILEDTGTASWDESRQYVEVSGSDGTGTAGDADFISEGFTVSAPYASNEAFCQVIADAFHGYISKTRRYRVVRIYDADGRIFKPMDRVTINGFRWSVYESDHEIADEEWNLTLLEDLEAA